MNKFDLKNKTAVITGGAQGFGLDIAKKFLSFGAKVIIWDVDKNELKKTFKKINHSNLSYNNVDVSDFKKVKKATSKINKYSKIDILINNAGITGPTAKLWNYSLNDWNKVLEINLNGTFNCCKAIVPSMIKNNYGRIVNIASVAGKEGNPNAAHYSASKSGVITFTRSLGKELANSGILVNCITPAVIETEMLAQVSDEHKAYMVSKIPMGRMGTADEVAAQVALLASPRAGFTSGTNVVIDGSFTQRIQF